MHRTCPQHVNMTKTTSAAVVPTIHDDPLLLPKRMACSISAGMIAAFATNPTETLRVRYQVLSGSSTTLGQLGKQIVRKEGLIRGLWIPGCTGWMASFGGAFGVRMGIYEYVR